MSSDVALARGNRFRTAHAQSRNISESEREVGLDNEGCRKEAEICKCYRSEVFLSFS